MFAFVWWLIVGLVAGLLARMLMPGRQPMGWLLTIVLGLIGSVVGGVIASVIFGTDPSEPGFQPAGLIMSTIGAVLVLWGYLAFERRRPNAV